MKFYIGYLNSGAIFFIKKINFLYLFHTNRIPFFFTFSQNILPDSQNPSIIIQNKNPTESNFKLSLKNIGTEIFDLKYSINILVLDF